MGQHCHRIPSINDLPVVPNLALVLPTGKLLFLVAGRPEVIEAIVFESQKFQIPNMLCVYIDPVRLLLIFVSRSVDCQLGLNHSANRRM